MSPVVDDPAVLAEVRAVFEAYEDALMAYDVDRLDAFFWRDPRVVRYGEGECQYGHEAIAAFRRTKSTVPQRSLRNTAIRTFGTDFAVANTEFVHHGETRLGRQAQTWVRTEHGWRIVAAHVSFLDEGSAVLTDRACGS